MDTPPIVFPGPVEHNLKAKAEEPEECKGKTYCTIKPADYPEELFSKMFKDAVSLVNRLTNISNCLYLFNSVDIYP